MRFLLVFALASSAAAFRTIKSRNTSSEDKATSIVRATADGVVVTTFDCDTLTGLAVAGHDFTEVAKLVCKNWPPSMGPFPATNVTWVTEMLGAVFNSGGMWEKFQQDKKNPARNARFCERAQVTREQIPFVASACPKVVTEEIRAELLSLGDEDKTFEAGSWACQDAADKCACLRRDDLRDDKPRVNISSRPDNCQMVHQNKCYGNCPRGHKPVWLTGYFRPVCNSICADTNHPFRCGLGCARSRQECSLVVAEQTKTVALTISRVASFVLNAPIIHSATQAVISLAEFAIVTLNRIVEAAVYVWNTLRREGAQLGVIMALYQFVKETLESMGTDWLKLSGLMTTAIKLVLDLIDTQFGWATLDLNWLINVFVKHGPAILDSGFQLATVFTYDTCQLATKETVFTIEDAGDERMVGPWYLSGQNDGKNRYVPKRVGDTVLEWNGARRSWNLWVRDTESWQGWWFWWLGLGWRILYDNQQPAADFPKEGWALREGTFPAPQLLAAEDDGTAIEGR
jgi:hypothetical protein